LDSVDAIFAAAGTGTSVGLNIGSGKTLTLAGTTKFVGSTSGTTTVQATAVAGTTTLTLPAATDTLVGRATTDTLTNKTLTTPVISSLSSASATALTLQSAGTTAITVDTSQNVGIGTASPAQVLEVSKSGNGEYGAIIRNATSGTNAGSLLRFYAGTDTAAILRFPAAHSSKANQLYITNAGTTSPITFATQDTERMRIDSSGYFLVGTTVANYLGHNSSNSMNSDGSTHALSLTTDASGFAEGGGGLFPVGVLRSASSAYVFSGFYSGNGSNSAFSDKEFSFRGDGNGYADGTWNNNGADYAEYFESANGQALTLGATVVLDGSKVRESTNQDDQSAIIGVVRPKEPSKASMVIGNTAWNKWANKYLTDDFDRYIMEDHDVLEWTDEDGKLHSYESQNVPSDVVVPSDAVRKTHDENGVKFQHYKINPEWNSDAEYVNRENRPEWNIIGLVGQVKLLKDQPVNARWIKMRDVSDSVEEWFIR
jgi:hypothetical protein